MSVRKILVVSCERKRATIVADSRRKHGALEPKLCIKFDPYFSSKTSSSSSIMTDRKTGDIISVLKT